MYCRIYDKAAEQKVHGHWIRVELQARAENAQKLAERMVGEGSHVVLSVLHGHLDFKEPGNGNITRRPTVTWWSTFLSGAPKLNLGSPTVRGVIEKVEQWLEQQAGPSIAVLYLNHGCSLDWLIAIIERSLSRLSARHLAMLTPDGLAIVQARQQRTLLLQ